MKKLLGAMATIALLTSPIALAQPGNQQNQQHERRGDDDRRQPGRQEPNRQAAQNRMAQHQMAQNRMAQNQAVQRQNANRRIVQRQAVQRQNANRRIVQRQAVQRQAANRAYNASTYRTRDYGYADPARYRNQRVYRGWAQNRGNAYRWSKGERMGYYDRYYAPRVSYQRYNLRRPPYGYEWRRFDDRYVLVGISTGLIMSVILNSAR
jgi:Ni/Co efflux regulator RcnB